MKAIVLKFLMTAAILGVILTGICGVAFKITLLISGVLTITAYIFGDLIVFQGVGKDYKRYVHPAQRNAVAAVSDAIIAFFIIWLMIRTQFMSGDILAVSLSSAASIAAGEWFFHKYLDKHVLVFY
ncbi:DUF2512 family protein [Domibacillus indicus]|uniref:DUF2512 family protein n=1 Tax=Domibacillus indicus TaxID=1437523 RepID=UPI001E345DD4|nr:DUF2512 family protein [Domibacillus indicus]